MYVHLGICNRLPHKACVDFRRYNFVVYLFFYYTALGWDLKRQRILSRMHHSPKSWSPGSICVICEQRLVFSSRWLKETALWKCPAHRSVGLLSIVWIAVHKLPPRACAGFSDSEGYLISATSFTLPVFFFFFPGTSPRLWVFNFLRNLLMCLELSRLPSNLSHEPGIHEEKVLVCCVTAFECRARSLCSAGVTVFPSSFFTHQYSITGICIETYSSN